MTNIESINKQILELKQLGESVKSISDGNHTFADLYFQRMYLFSVICSCYPELSWKSRKHFDEENDPMFNGDFIAGIHKTEALSKPERRISCIMVVRIWYQRCPQSVTEIRTGRISGDADSLGGT